MPTVRLNGGSGPTLPRTCSLWTTSDCDFTVAQSEDLYELVCQRDRQKSWIVVSNRLPGDWYGLFPNPVLAEGLLDRLVNTSYPVVLEGWSYRPRRRPGVEPPAETPPARC